MRRETQDIPGDERLDELLSLARWPEPSAESTQRLRREWQSLRAPRLANRFAWAAGVAAAVWIVIGSAVFLHIRTSATKKPAEFVVRAPVVTVEAPIARTALVVREATLDERLALLSTSPAPKTKPKPAPPRPAPVLPRKPSPDEKAPPHREEIPALVTLARTAKSVDARAEAFSALLARGDPPGTEAFLSLVLDPATRGEAMAALHGAPDRAAPALLAALDNPRVDYRLAAAKSLGTMCDHAGIGARLQQMVRENDNRREALAALVSCPGKPAADFLRAARFRPAIDVEVRAVQSELANIFRG